MATKAQIYNYAASALLLVRKFVDPTTDPVSNEKIQFDNFYQVALDQTLEDLDLDSTAKDAELELLDTNPEEYLDWTFVYKYPTDCVLFRRIKTASLKDNRTTRVPLKVAMFNNGVLPNQKAIFTNAEDAIGEYIGNDLPLTSLSQIQALCIGYKLAWLSAPVLVGKGAEKLKQEIEEKYIVFKMEAMETDRKENFNFEDDSLQSEYVEARTD